MTQTADHLLRMVRDMTDIQRAGLQRLIDLYAMPDGTDVRDVNNFVSELDDEVRESFMRFGSAVIEQSEGDSTDAAFMVARAEVALLKYQLEEATK